MKYRTEFDSIGKIKVPGDKYWELQPKDQTNILILVIFWLDLWLFTPLQ